MSRLTRLVGATIATAAILLSVSCGSDDEGSDDAGGELSVVDLLDELPASLPDGENGLLVVAGDLDAAGRAGGFERPGADADDESVKQWLLRIGGAATSDQPAAVQVALPTALAPTQLMQYEEYGDELGWNVLDVRQFIEYQEPPNSFTVFTGSFDDDELDDAMGARTNGVWRVGEEMSLAERSAARPLGQPLRMALDEDHLAFASDDEPVLEWLAEPEDTFADAPDLVDVAKVLDKAGIYTAVLAVQNFSYLGALAPSLDPEVLDEIDTDALLDPFSTVGLGLSVDGDRRLLTIAYQFADDDTADANVERLRAMVESGRSVVSDRPYSELLTVDEITTDGTVLVASLLIDEEAPASIALTLLYRRELLLTHR